MYGAYHMTTPTRTPKPQWAIAFKKRREAEVGSQEELAIRADVSQSLVSQIERGVQHPTGVSVERFARLLSALNWTAQAFSEATGISLGPTVEESPAPRRPGPPSVPSVVPFRQTRITIPRELQEMVEKHGDAYPVLKTEQMQRMLAAPRNFGGAEVGPQTAEDWFDYWMANKRFLT